MKKIYSFVFAALTILSAASCQKEMTTVPEANNDAVAFSFTATRESETKTVLVNGKSTWWTPDDLVSVFDNNNKAKSFSTDITDKAASALFTGMLAIPEDMKIRAIYPAKGDATIDGNGVIGILRVSGDQKAVAGSFDAANAVAYAAGEITSMDTPPTLQFSNIHSLVKFTIGGDTAPAKVTLTNNGSRNIAGQFKYNTQPAEGISPIVQVNDKSEVLPGAKSVVLTPAEGDSFKVGETYYIVVIGGGNFANVTLDFDGTIVKTVSGAKYADAAQNNYFINKIIDLGTVSFPAEEPDVEKDPADLTAERLWVKSFAELGLSVNGARNCATDGEYVFVPNSAASPVVVKAFPINGGDAIEVNMTGVEGGTHPASCVRMVKNSDSNLNGGKDLLVLCNLGINTTIKLYVYVNGISNAPQVVELVNTWRRLGDKFTYVGNWQNGQLRFPDWNENAAVVYWNRTSNYFANGTNASGQAWPDATYTIPSFSGITEFVTYPDATTDYALMVNTASAKFLNNLGESSWSNDPALAKAFGYNFFEINGNKYIAYAKLDANLTNGSLNIIEDKGSAAEFKNSLEAHNKHFTTTVLDTASSTAAGSSVCDCDVVQVNGKTYAAVLLDNCGLALYEIKAK